jgi:hypothetical protein
MWEKLCRAVFSTTSRGSGMKIEGLRRISRRLSRRWTKTFKNSNNNYNNNYHHHLCVVSVDWRSRARCCRPTLRHRIMLYTLLHLWRRGRCQHNSGQSQRHHFLNDLTWSAMSRAGVPALVNHAF